MLGSLAEVLPRAAERFGDQRALVVGGGGETSVLVECSGLNRITRGTRKYRLARAERAGERTLLCG